MQFDKELNVKMLETEKVDTIETATADNYTFVHVIFPPFFYSNLKPKFAPEFPPIF